VKKQASLVWLVAVGTFVVLVIGVALFGWLGWLQSHRPAPWHDPDGWFAWLSHVAGTTLADAARTTATLLAVVGVGGAALVAYRRQATAEMTYETAAKQHALDSNKYELDRQRHKLEESRRIDDRERELRGRFTTIAEQLSTDSTSVRHAGAYGLASLADDWHAFGNDSERQVCVDLLCAQLRSPRIADPLAPDRGLADLEVRKTFVALLRSRRPIVGEAGADWRSCSLDLSGADLSTLDLSRMDLSGVLLRGSDLTESNFEQSDLTGANMERATVTHADFSKANLTGASLYGVVSPEEDPEDFSFQYLNFAGARLFGANLNSAKVYGASFTRSDLTNSTMKFAKATGANFANAIAVGTDFSATELHQAGFKGTDLSGANLSDAKIAEAVFTGAKSDDNTKWPGGVRPDDAAASGP